MAEPKTKAGTLNELTPGLLHWGIEDDRIGEFRSDAFALRLSSGLAVIDPLPLEDRLESELGTIGHVFLTHGNHQRSAWRFRRTYGASVYAPVGIGDLDEEPDVLYDEETSLPEGLRAIEATSFAGACYLIHEDPEGRRTLFCGDLICHDPGGPYRFPEQPGYFDPAAGREDARRLIDLAPRTLCAAHAVPLLDGAQDALRDAIARLDAS